jgi:hypothetical protein
VFLELFPFDLFEEICHWSNIYKNKKAKETPKPKDFTITEIVRFVGLLIAHSIQTWASGVEMNWRKSTMSPFTPGTYIKNRNYMKQMKILLTVTK